MRHPDLAARIARLERAAGRGRAGTVRWVHLEADHPLSDDEIADEIASYRARAGWMGKIAVTLRPGPAVNLDEWRLRFAPAEGRG